MDRPRARLADDPQGDKGCQSGIPDRALWQVARWGEAPDAGFDFTDGLTDNEEGDSAAGQVFAEINFMDQKVMDAYNQANGIDTTLVNPEGGTARSRFIPTRTRKRPSA